MQMLLPVMVGGALGAGLRHLLNLAAPHGLFPWPTLIANILGGVAMGFLFGWLDRNGVSDFWRYFLGVGLLGGFTTFSAFSMETLSMLGEGRFGIAATYIALSLTGAIGGAAIGLSLARAGAAA